MRLARVISALCVSFLFPALASAAQRTFVSAAAGSDANNCSRLTACRNFPAAIAMTDIGGEIVVLDSGGYGAVSITRAVQLIAPPGVHAAITAFTGDGIYINAPGAAVRVVGIAITGEPGVKGVEVAQAAEVVLVRVSAVNFTAGFGVYAVADQSYLSLRDCDFSDNQYGMVVGASTAVRTTVDGTRFENNTARGFTAGSNATAIVKNSVASANAGAGFSCTANGSVLVIENSVASLQNSTSASAGVYVDGCTVQLSNCTITSNYSGVVNASNSPIQSRGNNTVVDNVIDYNGTVGSFAPR